MDYDAEVKRLLAMKSKKACVMECMHMLSELPAPQWYGNKLSNLRLCVKRCFTNNTQPILKPTSSGDGKADLSEISRKAENMSFSVASVAGSMCVEWTGHRIYTGAEYITLPTGKHCPLSIRT